MDKAPAWFADFANDLRTANKKKTQGKIKELADRVSALESSATTRLDEDQAKITVLSEQITAMVQKHALSDSSEVTISGILVSSDLDNKSITWKNLFSGLFQLPSAIHR